MRPGQRGPFFWAIDKYMSMLGVAGNRQKKIEQMMKDEGFVDQHYVKEDISSKLDWPAWDIVEGPANRADDPGEWLRPISIRHDAGRKDEAKRHSPFI